MAGLARAFVEDYPGIVAGRHIFCTELPGPVEQNAELDLAVAGYAGIGRSALHVFGDEIRNDALLEFLSKVHDVVRYAESAGHNPRVVTVLHRAATVFEMLIAADAVVIPQVHRDADDFAARVL